ncbi:MarR family winged helix-turn-helix transcriptional regulator [Vagococcus entomophilus]|uniref:MarR family winged helix-turn-helix transcriptional regulator n=1 Tax=Vagococcus entomophilus TaxID=1160095 RepID=UPI0014758693|nr:MarR family transcriptional regulator [Vagococcus entomophilus]
MNLFKSHGFKLNRLSNTASTQLENELMRKYDVTLSQWAVLAIVWEHEGIRSSDLQEILHVKVSTASGVIKRMEKKGLIVRKKNREDRREMHLYSTELSKNMAVEVVETVKELNREMLHGFSAEEKELFMNLMDRAYKNLTQ